MKRLLFLCTGNYYRSRFAEIVFNKLAKEHNLDWHADSCGLNISLLGPEHPLPISQNARDGLAARNIPLDPNLRNPRQVCEADLQKADLIIALKESEHRPLLEKLHPGWPTRVRYWHIHDIDVSTPEPALKELESHLHRLITELSDGSRLR